MNILYIGEPHSIHDIKWMTFFASRPGYTVYLIAEQHKLDDLGSDTSRLAQLNIRYLGTISSFSIRKGSDTIRSVRTIRQAIRQYDIHFVHFLFATPYSLWGLFLPVPYIITTRGSDVLVVLPYLIRSGKEGSIRNRILYFLLGKAMKNAAAITSTSLAQISQISHLFPPIKPSVLIRTGVPIETIQQTHPWNDLEEGKVIVFSPRYFNPVYGIELQLEALNLFSREQLSQMHFVFVRGISNYSDYANQIEAGLKKLAAEKGLSYQILEEVSQQQMFSIYKAAKLTIMTPRSDGTPNSALEAMAAGCPLIVPDLPYDSQLFNASTCHFLKGRDPQRLKDLIEYILHNDVSRVTHTAQETVATHGNREIEMGKLDTLYKQLFHQYYPDKQA